VATAATAAVVLVVVDVLVLLLLAWGVVEPEHAARASPATPTTASAPHLRRDPVDVAWVRSRSMVGVLIVGDGPPRGGHVLTAQPLGRDLAAGGERAT
jgi:hypothetical protein